MKTIRKNVFETNSSSTHSISISMEDNVLDIMIPSYDGVIKLDGGQFGRSWDKFNDPNSKASYAALADFSQRSFIEEIIKEHTGAEEVVFNFSDDYGHPNWSYIDHNGEHDIMEMFESKEKMKQFIFNPKSWLYTGSDESSAPPNFFDDEDTVYQSELVLDIPEEYEIPTIKFTEKNPTIGEISKALHPILERLRYNDTSKLWEYDPCMWSSREVYLEFGWNDEIDFKNKTITLREDKWGREKENPKTIDIKYSINEIS